MTSKEKYYLVLDLGDYAGKANIYSTKIKALDSLDIQGSYRRECSRFLENDGEKLIKIRAKSNCSFGDVHLFLVKEVEFSD